MSAIFAFDPIRVTDYACGLTWRGMSKDRAQMVKLAELFESDTSPYTGKWARRLAAECRAAIAEHDHYHAQQEAA